MRNKVTKPITNSPIPDTNFVFINLYTYQFKDTKSVKSAVFGPLFKADKRNSLLMEKIALAQYSYNFSEPFWGVDF